MIYDPEGRFIILQIIIDEDVLTLINVYAPTQSEGSEQASFLERLNTAVDELEISDVFMGGDFNIHIPSNSEQSEVNLRSSSHRATYINRIQAFLSQYDIADVWSYKFPLSNSPTFHRNAQSSTLDYWFIPTIQCSL